jgi:hypothetical protein
VVYRDDLEPERFLVDPIKDVRSAHATDIAVKRVHDPGPGCKGWIGDADGDSLGCDVALGVACDGLGDVELTSGPLGVHPAAATKRAS